MAADPVLGDKRWQVILGDSREKLKLLPDNYAHAVVCDPPAGIAFMAKEWDCFRRAKTPQDVGRPNVFGRTSAHAPHSYGESERGAFIEFMVEVMREALRVLRPGGHAVVWALPRTSHWTATAIEDAGFEIRDRLHDVAAADSALAVFLESLPPEHAEALIRILEGQTSPVLLHLFGNGFPKGVDVAKAIDKAAGVEPIGEEPPSLGMALGPNADQWNDLKRRLIMPPPTTPEAKQWAGWNTALKPAAEHWIVARKPLDKGATVAENMLRWGTGAYNVGACRVAHAEECRILPDQHGDSPSARPSR